MKAKVRFHLARGINYQRWQVKTEIGITYYDPDDHILQMDNATLRNQRKTAERICGGENKSVCAWVECDDIKVTRANPDTAPVIEDFAHYNPKRRPFWHNSARENLDNANYERLATYGRLIIIPK